MFASCKEENKLFNSGYKFIAGIDEVGRGSLAGPVTVTIVIFDKHGFNQIKNQKLKDSKHLTSINREKFSKIIKKFAIKIKTINISNKIIDKININNAINLGLGKLITKLKIKPNFLLLDGGLAYKFPISSVAANLRSVANFQFPKKILKIEQKTIIKGDEKCFIISAASIIAKVSRDALMKRISKKYPQYKFDKHKGYGTKLHFQMIKKYGPTSIHRTTFLKNVIFRKD